MKKTILPVVLSLFFYTALVGQVTLPFNEGFENIGTTTTFTSNTTSINGLSEWSYERTSRGRLRFKSGTSFYNNGSAAATLDVSANNNNSTNYLILSLDLSNYKNSQLELSFYFMHHGEESNSEDRVWIRGSSSDSWIEIYNWYNNRGTAGNWNKVSELDIDRTLKANSQSVSSSFQVRFGQRDNFQARSTTRDDGVTFDDIEIKEVFERNGVPIEVKGVCAGKNDVNITLYNNGLDTIKTGQIDWWINGVKQKGKKFTQTIAPEQNAEITLGEYTFGTSNYNLVAFVDSINGDLDQSRNDTLKQNLETGLAGSYTIGGASADFSNLSGAINALNTRGICSSVNFKINNGTYTGAFVLDNIVGSSTSNTITFDGGDSSKTIIANNSGTVNYTFACNGTKNIIFKNIQFQSARWALYLRNATENVTISNCYFNLSQTGTSQDIFGIVASESVISEAANGNNTSKLSIKNCNFVGGERAIQLMGDATTSSKSIQISSNIFSSIYYSALGLYNLKNVQLKGNNIANFRANSANAIVAYDLDDVKMTENFISGRNFAIYFQDFNLNTNSASEISNNIITSTGNGVYLNNARVVNIYHNTFVGNYALRLNTHSGIDLRNNILYGNGGYALYSPANGGYTELDWNHYYSTATNKISYDNNNYTSLNNWRSDFSELNLNSVESNPPISSVTSPYLTSSNASSRAKSIGIRTDIDGDSRCRFPSIGADESKYADPKPSVKFSIPDSSYVDAIVNAKNLGNINNLEDHNWYVGGKKVDSTSFNLNYRFASTGRYKITLQTSNCSAFDTTSKFIVIKKVEKAPIARFSVSKKKLKVGEVFSIANNSLNGPSKVIWSITPYFMGGKTRTYQFVNNTDSNTFEPNIYFTTPGDYSVCLYVSNIKGNDQKCKINHITVLDEAEICTSTGSYVTEGILRDPGGLGNYAGRQRYNCSYTIEPCAKNLKLKFTEFDIVNNRDYLRIYDGVDNTGKALHDYNTAYSNGLTGDNQASYFKSALVANSGSAYIEFTSNWVFGAPGFEIEWSSTPLNVSPPIADFAIPNTICVGTELNIENKSTGKGNRYTWQFLSKVTNTVEYSDSSINHFFFFKGDYSLRLIVTNCGGSDTLTKNIKVVEATNAPTAKINIDITNPDKGQVVTLSDISTLKGYLCSEYRTWSISPSSFSFVTGYNSQNQITKVTFSDTGCYDIQLIASNSNGIDTILVKCAVRVIDRCVPKVGNLNSDIGIARVNLEGINNASSAGLSAYTDYRADHRAYLQQGAFYELTIWRDKNPQNALNRAAWIDYNQDGDFNDTGEEIAISSGSNTLLSEEFKFRIPKDALLGSTTLRIGVSRGTSSNTPCGENNVGEFEDYRIIIIKDFEAPIVTLYGSDTIQIEQCSKFLDPMGFAIDNTLKDTMKLVLLDTLNTSIVGNHQIRYSATDSSMNQTVVSRVFVVIPDTTAPTLFIKGSDTIYHEVKTTYLDPGYEARDNCMGLIDTGYCSVDENIIGIYNCFYEAKDAQGSTKKVGRTVIVQDTKAPTIDSLFGGDTIEHQINTAYIDKGVAFNDNYYSNIDVDITIKGLVDTTKKGTYVLWYILTDKSGNRDSIFRTVIVDDYQTPVVTLVGSKYITIDVFDTYIDDSVTYTDFNGGTNGLTLSITGTYIDSFGHNKTADIVGQFTLIYTVESKGGNKSVISRTINVLDREKPVLTLKGANPMELLVDDDFIEPGWTVTDNYWGTANIWVYNFGVVNTELPDTYYVYYFAADSSANVTDTIIRTVIVKNPDGIDESHLTTLKVYPNPTNGFVIVELAQGIKPSEIQIFDASGKQVLVPIKYTESHLSIDLTTYADGIYKLLLINDGVIHSSSIIKQ